MSTIPITILMTVYNGGSYLRQSIESVLRQSYRNFEFLIINDCSTDNTVEIISSYKDARIVLHNNVHNLGQTQSLNEGLRLAKGIYVGRIDADDLAFPHWIETQMNFLEKHPDCAVVSANAAVINESNQLTKVYEVPDDREGILLRAILRSPINHVGSVFLKEDIVQTGGYDQDYKIAADYKLWTELLKKDKTISSSGKILIAIREHEQSTTRQEQNKVGSAEIRNIMTNYIHDLIETPLTEGEIQMIYEAHYESDRMSEERFQGSLKTLEKIFESIKSSWNVGEEIRLKWRKKQMLTFYLKRIYHLIQEGDSLRIRKIAQQAIKALGTKTILILLYLGSFTGKIFLNFIPRFYKRYNRQKIISQLGQPITKHLCLR